MQATTKDAVYKLFPKESCGATFSIKETKNKGKQRNTSI